MSRGLITGAALITALAMSSCAMLKRCPGGAGCPQQPVENFAALTAPAPATALPETAAAK